MIRFLVLCICSVAVCPGWHDPHIAITRAALASLPAAYQGWFGPEAEHISETYCWNPDRYHNVSAPEQAVMRTFCERPDGTRIHNVSWDRKADLPSVEYLLERLIADIRSGNRTEAAEFAGTLAH